MGHHDTIKRRYDIGQGIILSDDGCTLNLSYESADGKTGWSQGIHRPKPMPEGEVEVLFSLAGDCFYLPGYCNSLMAWMGSEKMSVEDARTEHKQSALFGPGYAQMKHPSDDPAGEAYCRKLWPFSLFKVKEARVAVKRPVSDPLVQDYLLSEQIEARRGETRFNEAIAATGWTLLKLMDKIGPWVPPTQLPIVKLELEEQG